jgi:ferredoxin/flavodoxin---NADP+ reductase
VSCLFEDLRAGALPLPPSADRIDALLAERRPDVVTGDGWRTIDARERERGRGAQRPRIKLVSREDLLAAAGRAGP